MVTFISMPELPRCSWEGRTGCGAFGAIFGHLSVVVCGLCMGGGGEGKGEVVGAGRGKWRGQMIC
jgi:hypothetical protein